MKTITKLWAWLFVIAVFSPLSLLLSRHFNAGKAWGEWDSQELKGLAGYIPRGLAKLSSFWKAPIQNYEGIPYIVSAAIGILACIGIVFILGKFLRAKK